MGDGDDSNGDGVGVIDRVLLSMTKMVDVDGMIDPVYSAGSYDWRCIDY